MERSVEFKPIYIECECGTHVLQVTNEVEFFKPSTCNTPKTRVRQSFWLAMFQYGRYHKKPSLWYRLGVIWNYLKTTKMHEDQMILTPDEAKKLADFINDNMVPTEKDEG